MLEDKKSSYPSGMTTRSLYFEIGKITGATTNDETGRNAKIEKQHEQMNALINSGYKRFYPT